MGGRDLRPSVEAVDLAAISANVPGPGTVWTEREGRDLNANLVRFPRGEGVGEHVNGELDVLFVGVSGSGTLEVDGRGRNLGPGVLVLVPKGARRATRSASDDFSYLTVHRKRGPVRPRAGRGGPNA
ncbi:MAG TPA: cupin domain-containing protein [Rubrobacter sp.]|nr:cupin domain-containing protein [Rubrobacter sp.]